MALTVHGLAQICGSKAEGGDPNAAIFQLLTDSRAFNGLPGSCFFALKTLTNDGVKYIEQLANRGLSAAVVHPGFVNPSPKTLSIIEVPNTLLAMQQVATYKRNCFMGTVVGITGSNGKTTVKEWLYQLVTPHFKAIRSPGSFNSQTGVPLSVWNLSKQAAIGIIEAGISKPGEMELLEPIIRPQIGIFTNIGAAHQGNFESLDQKIKEKCLLFRAVEKLLLSSHHDHLLSVLSSALPEKSIITWGHKKSDALRILAIHTQNSQTQVKVRWKNHPYSWQMPFTDAAGIENAIHAALGALVLGVSPENIAEGLPLLEPLAMRLELRQGANGNLLINDTYNSDPESIDRAIAFLKQHQAGRNAVIILSDLHHMGESPEPVYKHIGQLVQAANPTFFIGVGPEITKYQKYFPRQSGFVPDPARLFTFLSSNPFKDCILLIKGARPFKLERLFEHLALKTHVTRLEVNLTALTDNLRYLRSLLKPTTKIMAMVKAFGYGGGSFELANALAYHHVDYLAVAYTDEGATLREAGIQLPIMVMNADPSEFFRMISLRLEPEIYSPEALKAFVDVWQFEMPHIPEAGIHLKIETGMNRLGLDVDRLQEVIHLLQQHPGVRVQSVFSHLAAAGDTRQEAFTRQQYEKFMIGVNKIEHGLGYRPICHLLNSSGIFNYPEYQLDMVRPGISLYGITNHHKHSAYLKAVSSLKTHISQLKQLKAGESAGYDRAFVAETDCVLATLPVGYADGYRRALGNGKGLAAINGKKAKVVGHVCMDMLMVDVTGLPCKEGDEAELFGSEIAVSDLADLCETIPYEILAGVSGRVKRVFFQE
jgi:Alr-MurF fusion protein